MSRIFPLWRSLSTTQYQTNAALGTHSTLCLFGTQPRSMHIWYQRPPSHRNRISLLVPPPPPPPPPASHLVPIVYPPPSSILCLFGNPHPHHVPFWYPSPFSAYLVTPPPPPPPDQFCAFGLRS